MSIQEAASVIKNGETYLGIELGSTRIKCVLIDRDHKPLASGSHNWENSYDNNLWTYSLEDIHHGVRQCYASMAGEVSRLYGIELETVGAIGVSGMMHGYLAFDDKGNLLVPFRTWRNTFTTQAAGELTELFNYNIPERWSVAHLYHAIKNNEPHVAKISHLTTLAGYIHWQLTGEKVLGIGEASGMFPVDSETKTYDSEMLRRFDSLIAAHQYAWRIEDILPKVLNAGALAGHLTEKGANFLDSTGKLKSGIKLCPPEGDAGTGMVATNCIRQRTGNISAGTSIFAMVVLERALSRVYSEIDMVTTPTGAPVAMVHCNNCTGDIDAWVKLFGELLDGAGVSIDISRLYSLLYNKALEGDTDCGGLLSYNYLSGEPVTEVREGRPLIVRSPESRLTLANFMRAQLYSAVASIKLGMDILTKNEGMTIDGICGHGGLFKTDNVAQRILAAALNTPVTVMSTAGEGGPWGMAVLAAYMCRREAEETLEDYLDKRVFSSSGGSTVLPDEKDAVGFESYINRFKSGLSIERIAAYNV